MLVGNIGIAIQKLDAITLDGLKTCIEAKFNAIWMPDSLPSDAKQLINILRNNCSFLDIQFAKLVIRFLKDEELHQQLAEYEELVPSVVEATLKECERREVIPVPPPNSEIVSFRSDVDPLSYPLYHILEMKNFLVQYLKMDEGIFAGLTISSVVLHFFIAVDDMETVKHGLKKYSKELLKLKVASVKSEGRFTFDVSSGQLCEVSMQEPRLLNSGYL